MFGRLASAAPARKREASDATQRNDVARYVDVDGEEWQERPSSDKDAASSPAARAAANDTASHDLTYTSKTHKKSNVSCVRSNQVAIGGGAWCLKPPQWPAGARARG